MSVFVYLYVDLFVWVCLCVFEEKEDEGRRSLRLSSFCTEKREEKKKVRKVKLIKL